MEITEFTQKLEETFKKHFPNGFFKATKSALFDEKNPTMFYSIGLIGKEEHCSFRIRENDPAYTIFRLDGLTLDTITGTGLYCNPEKGSHYAMDRRKIPFRKTTKKNYDDLLKSMDKYFEKMHQFIQENKKDVYGGLEQYPEIYFK